MNLANKITVARICLIPLFIACMQQYPDWAADHIGVLAWMNDYGAYTATFVFLLAAATDKLDGYIARRYNQVTNFGKLVDPLADKLLVSAGLIMLVQSHQIPAWAAVAIIMREVLVTAMRMAAISKGVVLAADRYGKLKLVSQVAAIALTIVDFAPVDILCMYAAVALTIISGLIIIGNYRRLELHAA